MLQVLHLIKEKVLNIIRKTPFVPETTVVFGVGGGGGSKISMLTDNL
jgi:hypothetical protein